MASRRLEDLVASVRFPAMDALNACRLAKIDVLVTCTLRDGAEQDRLYAQGRTTPGRKVTNARAGQSFHQYGVALDLYPVVNGKPDFSGTAPEWQRIATIFKLHGFEWAGDWKRFREMPHFQMTMGKPLSYFQNGGTI